MTLEDCIKALHRTALKMKTFTTEDAWGDFPEGRRIGAAAVHYAKRQGWMVPTENFGRSIYHRKRPCQIWESRLI